MAYQSEAKLEDLLMKQLVDQGYTEVAITDYDQLKDNFKEQFQEFNKAKLGGTPLSDKEWDRLFVYMEGKSVFECGQVLRDKYVLERDDGTKVYLSFIDEDFTKNKFQVTHQVTVVGKYVNRYDVTILVNGLPLIQIELKRRGVDLRLAINQINRYKKHSYHGLYRYVQIFVVSNGTDTKYFANTDRNVLYSQTFFWTDKDNIRITSLKEFSVVFLARDHIIKMIRQFTVMNAVEKIMMIMRPYQVYAAEALIRQAQLTNRNAFIWHTTGSGKTLTSFKTAQVLSTNPNIKKVIFLVDRQDLDSQTTEEFNKFQPDSVDSTDNTNMLVKMMKDKSRTLIVTTIQKMSNAVKKERYAKIMDQYRDEKVVFIIDECHRSQFGDMHNDLVRHFKGAQFFGFTGTPRFAINGQKKGVVIKTTKELFGDCLHTYLIKDAIFDNNVLGFHVEYIKTIEGAFDEYDEQKVKGIDIAELYNSPERMTVVANHIIENHTAKTRNRQYTAMFTVESIPALIRYYDIFKTIDHDLNITGIFTYGANEDGEDETKEHSRDALERIIQDYNEMFNTNFSTDTYSAYHKDISDRVKGKKAKPIDILLVVRQFLTGFDSKPLSVLYVDKELKWHDLLQAYSRTNRVEKETKPYGIIVCYRNLKKATDDALTLFSMSKDTGIILTPDFEELLNEFNDTVFELKKIAPQPAAIDTMQSEDDQKEFILVFKKLAKLLLSLQTYVEFPYEKHRLVLTEEEYLDYKDKYMGLYHKEIDDKTSVLADVDFCIELMESDRINVAYIMNLIRNIDFTDFVKKQQDIDHIREELNRADNEQMRKKVDLLKAFLDELETGYDGHSDIDDLYNDFENRARHEEIHKFAEKEELDEEVLTAFISEYEFSNILNAGRIRDSIKRPLPLLKKRSLVNRIVDFIRSFAEKFQ